MDNIEMLGAAGIVEQLLLKLIQERVSLVNGEKLVADFRMIVSELVNAQQQLDRVKSELQQAQLELDAIQVDTVNKMNEAEVKLQQYHTERTREIQADIDALLAQRTLLVTETSNTQGMLDAVKHEYENTVQEYANRVNTLEASIQELNQAKQSISESINAAVQMINS